VVEITAAIDWDEKVVPASFCLFNDANVEPNVRMISDKDGEKRVHILFEACSSGIYRDGLR